MIDFAKKYKLHGDVFEYDGFGSWVAPAPSGYFCYETDTMERFINEGYAAGFVEPMRVEFVPEMPYLFVTYNDQGFCVTDKCPDWIFLQLRDAAGGRGAVADKTFRVTFENDKMVATEVIR